jgi:hypothetical protein
MLGLLVDKMVPLAAAMGAAPPRIFDAARFPVATRNLHSNWKFRGVLASDLARSRFAAGAEEIARTKEPIQIQNKSEKKDVFQLPEGPLGSWGSIFSEYADHTALNLEVVRSHHNRRHF